MDGANFSINAAGYTEIDLQNFIPDPMAVSKLDIDLAKQCNTVPISYDRLGNRLVLATESIQDVLVTERLVKSVTDPMHVSIGPLRCESVDDAIDQCYSAALDFGDILQEFDAATSAHSDERPSHSHPLVRLVNSMLHAAVDLRASDIHINPFTKRRCQIRFRVDGVISLWQEMSAKHLAAVVVRIKLLASLDIAESRLPQDGQFRLQIKGRWIDFRVSTFPTTFGENIVLRVLDKRARRLRIDDLIAGKEQQTQVKSFCGMKDGLAIVCGPTGCGKSTTLMAMLAELDSQSLNVMTLEDPVENVVEGIQQCSIRAEQQLDYAGGVRALLRQDPDVLLIGEIRDAASAAMAIRAALTGHGVFTTIHCRDTQSAITRLLDLGVSHGDIAGCVNVVIAQRLVRKLCAECSGSNNSQNRCSTCHGVGYYGRIAVLEIMPITDSIKRLLTGNYSIDAIWRDAKVSGLQTLRSQIELLVKQGLTDQDELQRVLGAVQ